MHTEFRNAQASDLSTLQRIARGNIDTHYRSILGDEGVDQFINSGASDRYIESTIGGCTVMHDGKDILGFAVCQDNLLALIMVDLATQGRGCGKALLRHCEQELLQHFEQIKLESFEGNTRANQFYERNGWSLSHRQQDDSSGVQKYIFLKRVDELRPQPLTP